VAASAAAAWVVKRSVFPATTAGIDASAALPDAAVPESPSQAAGVAAECRVRVPPAAAVPLKRAAEAAGAVRK
jgi:hypothetical protein